MFVIYNKNNIYSNIIINKKMSFLSEKIKIKKASKYYLYCVENYAKADNKFINSNAIYFDSLKEVVKELKNKDNSYHFRVHNN